MHHRKHTVRGFLHSQESGESRAEIRRMMKVVRQDDEMSDMLTETVEYAYDYDGNRQQDGPFGGVLTDFLEWLLANKDGIIAFIKEIIALFMPTGLPTEAPATA